jgi:putative transposase
MNEFERLRGRNSWIDLEFIERERTPHEVVEIGIHLHVAGLSLSSTKQILERLGVKRSRTAIHNWVQKACLQPSCDGAPNHVAVDETVIQVNDERHWLFAAVDPEANEIPHARLFQTQATQLTVLFLRDSSNNSWLSRPRSSSMLRRHSLAPSTDSACDFRRFATEIGTASNVSLER